MNSVATTLALLAAVGAVLFFVLRHKGQQEKLWLAQRRAEIGRQFTQVNVAASEPFLALNGCTAQVVHETENIKRSDGLLHHYSVTRYVRNENGEYFMLLSTEGAPFVKHITQEAARVVLKSKYVAARNDS